MKLYGKKLKICGEKNSTLPHSDSPRPAVGQHRQVSASNGKAALVTPKSAPGRDRGGSRLANDGKAALLIPRTLIQQGAWRRGVGQRRQISSCQNRSLQEAWLWVGRRPEVSSRHSSPRIWKRGGNGSASQRLQGNGSSRHPRVPALSKEYGCGGLASDGTAGLVTPDPALGRERGGRSLKVGQRQQGSSRQN